MLTFVVSLSIAADNKPATTPKADDKKDAPEKKELIHAAGKAAPGVLVIRVSCGGKTDYTDLSGVTWSADQVYSKGKKWGVDADFRTSARKGVTFPTTDAPGIYTNERDNMNWYRFDVPNGKYTVRLHHCETWEGASKPGQRSFGVKVQGKVVLKDLDLVRDVGFMKPFVKEVKDVEVTDGKLMVEFIHPPVHQHPQVNAIEVIGEQAATDKPTEKKVAPEKQKEAP